MVTYMNDQDIRTVVQVRAFLDGTESVEFEVQGKQARYAWIEHTLKRFRYGKRSRVERGGSYCASSAASAVYPAPR